MNNKILVVDDEKNIVELVKYNLENEGFKVLEAYDGEEAVNIAKNNNPDLIILDLMLPKKTGYDVIRTLKEDLKTKGIPVIMLTAKGEEVDKILGLEMGADDYITKPFSPREIVARVRAVTRRTYSEKPQEVANETVIGQLAINPEKHEVKVGDNRIELTNKEFELLKMLAENRGKVFSREVLLDKIWGYDYLGDTRTVDVHIRHLRQKIESTGFPPFIVTVRGVGYKFKDIR